MIGPELVRARRRGDKLQLQALSQADREAATMIADQLLLAARVSVDGTYEEVEEALGVVPHDARSEKLWAGLRKLVMDACTFDASVDLDPSELRRRIFSRAAEVRRELEVGEPLPRESILREVGAELGVDFALLEPGLFGDLKGARRLLLAPTLSVDELLARYELQQLQGVLLRAVRLTALVSARNPAAYRRLFHKLKFRQLLYRLAPLEGGRYQLEIDGPFSLFESVTKYGLQLALLVPALLACDSVELSAELRWGKERKTLHFETRLVGTSSVEDEACERPEVQALLGQLSRGTSGWTARPAERLFDLPGIGVVVPDLVMSAAGKPDVFVEIMGFWSREAVWRRVEWAEARRRQDVAGELPPLIFAVSSRLRVSEEVLPDELSAALYVYKGSLSARALSERAERVSAVD